MNRRHQALDIREAAARMAADRVHPAHVANGDETRFRGPDGRPNHLASFTKGMPHDFATGLIQDPQDFQSFVRGIDSGDPRDFVDTPLGPVGYVPRVKGDNVNGEHDDNPVWRHEPHRLRFRATASGIPLRAWESQAAGNLFDLEGPDAQAVTMPPAPALGSAELTGEMGEVYAQALLRDVPFSVIDRVRVESGGEDRDEHRVTFDLVLKDARTVTVEVSAITDALAALPWFAEHDCCRPAQERARTRDLAQHGLFRGITPGDAVGPYISQFLLAGNAGRGPDLEGRTPADGYIEYGAITIDQRVRTASPGDDHMTRWSAWFDVQQAANVSGGEAYVTRPGAERRFITTPRDLATYVHFDALYEAYLDACLILLAEGVPFDPGLPFQRPDHVDHQQGFAHFGGPHILSLVTEVATRALKAVRFQKFNVHRRLRPEALAARIARQADGTLDVVELADMQRPLQPLLDRIAAHNGPCPVLGAHNYLLPMAFSEGSPMHPAYGAGHATVAGACVTILKAFFDHAHPLEIAGSDTSAYVPTPDGSSLQVQTVTNGRLTVEGELNKLASNISIGRDWAGVHYFSDYIESVRMGERIAIGILEEQKLTYPENFSMTVPLYDGGTIRI